MKIKKPTECSHCGTFEVCSHRLECGHEICTDLCFQKMVLLKTDDHLEKYDRVTCPACLAKVSPEKIKTAFGGPESFRKELIKNSKKYEPKLLCELCYSERPSSDFVTLDCNHKYCGDCIKGYLIVSINEGKVGSSLTCFEDETPIGYYTVLDNLEDDMKEKYEKFLLRSIEAIRNNEVYIQCIGKPGIECEYAEFISVDREIYECPRCSASFCAKCKGEPHPKLSCRQYKRLQMENPSYQELIIEGQASYCPWCDVFIIKDGGCKYIACQSEECKKNKHYFCWDCKAKLTEKHGVHPCSTPDVISNKLKQACFIF